MSQIHACLNLLCHSQSVPNLALFLLLLHPWIHQSTRDGSLQASAIREVWSVEGTDAWVDDPITRYVVSIQLKSTEDGDRPALLWPLVVHSKGQYQVLVLPLVEPHHLATYEDLAWRKDCGGGAGGEASLSALLLQSPCITG